MARRFKAVILLATLIMSHAQVVLPGAIMRTIPAAGGGGPTEVASDDFSTQSAFTDLDDDTDWEAEQGAIIVIGSAQVTSGASGDCLYRWVGAGSFTSDQYATCTISDVGTSFTDSMGCAVRVQDAATGYGVKYDETDQLLTLIYINAGSSTDITSVAKNYANGVQLRLRASGAGASTRLNVWEDTGSGWVQVFTDENPAVDIDNGSPGLLTNGAGSNAAITDWTGGNW